MRLHRTPDEDRSWRKTRVSLIAPALLMIYGLLMPVLMLVFYVFPYQAGSGELNPDGSLNWFTGEAILAVCTALVWIPLGLLSAWLVLQRYSPR